MPKLGMEPIRRADIVNAALQEIGEAGSVNVTVSQIAGRAGVSSALAHHYFGGKEQILIAAMRHALSLYTQEVLAALRTAETPADRLKALIGAGFTPVNFRPEIVSAWLNFYVLSLTSSEAARLLEVYRRRLRSNLVYDLRRLIGDRASGAALRIAALIDGLYLRAALEEGGMAGEEATEVAIAALNFELNATDDI